MLRFVKKLRLVFVFNQYPRAHRVPDRLFCSVYLHILIQTILQIGVPIPKFSEVIGLFHFGSFLIFLQRTLSAGLTPKDDLEKVKTNAARIVVFFLASFLMTDLR